MDLISFSKLVNDPRRTKDELRQMLRNAVEKGNVDFARVAKETLNSRFPGWDSVRSRKGGTTPARTVFRGIEREFPTAKEAYCWLIERFIEAYPRPFRDINWETVFVAKGRQRNYFSRSLDKMFHGTPRLAEDPNNYALLPNGQYANLNLNNDQKFKILCKLAAVAGLRFESDWHWEVHPQLCLFLISSIPLEEEIRAFLSIKKVETKGYELLVSQQTGAVLTFFANIQPTKFIAPLVDQLPPFTANVSHQFSSEPPSRGV